MMIHIVLEYLRKGTKIRYSKVFVQLAPTVINCKYGNLKFSKCHNKELTKKMFKPLFGCNIFCVCFIKYNFFWLLLGVGGGGGGGREMGVCK